MESEFITFALNNGVGVIFGVLMYRMADKFRKENVQATNDLKDAITVLCKVLQKKL